MSPPLGLAEAVPTRRLLPSPPVARAWGEKQLKALLPSRRLNSLVWGVYVLPLVRMGQQGSPPHPTPLATWESAGSCLRTSKGNPTGRAPHVGTGEGEGGISRHCSRRS